MTEKLNNGTLNRETSDHETQAAIREAAAGFLDVHLPDFSGNKAEVAAAKRGLLTVILKTAGRPMRVAEIKDIMDDLVERAGQEVAMANVSLQLTAMKNQGGVQLLERGVYAHNELDSRDYEKSMTIGENILAALDASETPLTTGEIKDYCLSHARQPISRESVDTELRIMSQRGAIKHLHTNAYAPAGFDSETYERSLTNQQLVVRILTEHNQPMTADGLVMAFKEVGRDAKVATVRSSLNKLYHQKRIRRLEDGVYACLDFNPDLYQTMNTMSQTLEVLNAEPKPMT
ncbi:hypothetical protein F4X86_03200, partial [Candidatus Saccharibacteria bacterium]|nr:hypothetical protein [Candidatus Saccharibacteria bacterium]